MSTTSTVCQGLQSCLEPFLFEPRVLMHQLVPSKQPENSKKGNKNGEESLNCWNFMQSATNPLCNSRDEVYVHPLSKRSTSSLSTKSLEMCTESLGSETGSLINSSTDEYCYEKQSSDVIKVAKTRQVMKKKVRSFPPPLTSISGSAGVQVQTHREGGRLVIKAFSYSCCSSYFQAERENGRLRLSLLIASGDGEREDENENEEEVGHENCDEGGDWGENIKDDGGKVGCKEWSSSRCNDDRRIKRLEGFPVWVTSS
ncbi:hypothetical protein ACS0TY_007610 [Phlomoides rotata]